MGDQLAEAYMAPRPTPPVALPGLGELKAELGQWLANARKVAVVGIGSRLRRDDAVGLVVLEKLKRLRPHGIEGVELVEAGSAPENILGKLASLKPSHVILIDAAAHGSRPGSVRLVRPEEAGSAHIITTHTLPLSFLCSYIKRETGAEVLIIGVQPLDLGLGEGLSPDLELVAENLANSLLEVLSTWAGKHSTYIG